MKIGPYKINSSVVIASILATLGGMADFLTNGAVVGKLAEILLYFIGQPESFHPYLTERLYQFLTVFAPIIMIILRTTNLQYKPPIEKIVEK